MKTTLAALALLMASFSRATTLYVWTNSPADGPGTAWTNAFHSIQSAIDAAATGDVVRVTNGVYETGGRAVFGALTNRIVLDRPLTVQSVNGPAVTTVRGSGPVGDGAVRCAYVGTNAVLSGFTLTQGATRALGDGLREQSGGGVWCEPSAQVTHCTISGNAAYWFGGGAHDGTLDLCTLTGNSAMYGGGAHAATLNHCTLSSNTATLGGGGAHAGTLNTCLLRGNAATNWGGGAYLSILNNCTVAGNASALFGGGSSGGTQNNCIVYYNTAVVGTNYHLGTFRRSCTLPDPGPAGNLTNAPAFMASNDFHLAAGSPCIDAGTNLYLPAGPDADGIPRPLDGNADGTAIADMGAYEFVHPAADSDADGLADTDELGSLHTNPANPDSDGDGARDPDELVADTDPTNSASVLAFTGVCLDGPGIRVDWQGGALATQYVERRASLTDTGLQWTAIFTNLPPTPLSGSLTTETTPGPLLLRIRVQP